MGRLNSNNNLINAAENDWQTVGPRWKVNRKQADGKTIDGVIRKAFEDLPLSSKGMSFVWYSLSQIIAKTQTVNKRWQQELRHELDALITRTLDGLNQYGPIELSRAALGIAKIIRHVLTSRNGHSATSSHYKLFHDLLVGSDGTKKDEIFNAIAAAAAQLLPRFDQGDNWFDAQGYSNLAYACAIAQVKPKFGERTLFDCIADNICSLKEMSTFKPQDLSNILWSFAKVSVAHVRLFNKVANEVVEYRQLEHFKPQDFSITVWAYAKAEVPHVRLFNKLAYEVVEYRQLESFEPQDFSNIVWAFVKAGILHIGLFHKVADEITRRDLAAFKPQALSNIAWAFAKAGVSQIGLFHKVADEITRRDLGTFKPQELSNIVWAFATAKVMLPALSGKMASVIMGRNHELCPQEVSNVMWAYTTLGLVDSPLFERMSPRVKALLGQCNSQDIAGIAWSYAVASKHVPTLFDELFIDIVCDKIGCFNTVQLCQIYQWHLWQQEEIGRSSLPPALVQKCYDAFISSEPLVSALQNDVVRVLRSFGLVVKEEHLAPSGYSLDALVEVNGRKVGIEVDGPSNFIDRIPTGNTLLKRRQIATVERIALISVPYWEWNSLGKDKWSKQKYLRTLLGKR